MVLRLTKEQSVWLSRMRAEWLNVMKPFSLQGGSSDPLIKPALTFTPIPVLGAHHLCNAKLLPSREALLEILPKGGIIGEIGTQHGYFAKKLHDIIKPRELHLFDLTFEPFESAQLLPATDVITKHAGDSSTSLASFPDQYFDWLYIDGDHSYDGVTRDIAQAILKLKASGFLVFNDFTYWSPLELAAYGVAHAVCELCLHHDWEVLYLTLQPLMYCDIVVRPRSARGSV
jgi:hypothetical protein